MYFANSTLSMIRTSVMKELRNFVINFSNVTTKITIVRVKRSKRLKKLTARLVWDEQKPS